MKQQFRQVKDLNVHTAEFSEINFNRAWWYIRLFVQERSPYPMEEYLCPKCLDAYHSDDADDPAHKCIQEEWMYIDLYYDSITILNDIIVLKKPYHTPLPEEDMIYQDQKIKEQETCFNNFHSLKYYQDFMAEANPEDLCCF